MESKSQHILMVPFTAHGHLRPFMELATLLLRRTGFTVTILTTPLNTDLLRSRHPNSGIRFVSLPFDSTEHGLPPGIENTDKLPLSKVISLFAASSALEPHLRRFISDEIIGVSGGSPPLCIIFDVFCSWANAVANSFGSAGVAFTTCGAYGTAAYLTLWNELPHRRYIDDEDFSLPGFPPDHRFRRSYLHPCLRDADGTWCRTMQPLIRMSMEAVGWICNSVEEMEPLGFQILRNYIKLPVWAVGPLISPTMLTADASVGEPSHPCIEFLNTHKQDSVLYISFGSQNTISPTQMMELAKGLEESGLPFLWVIKPPFGFDINGEFQEEWLPEGFEERMREKKQGFLVHKWGPQLEILKHRSTGAFLSHCGWNSVLEGLSQGIPMMGWPVAAEQAYNLKLMVDGMGVAVELAWGHQGKVEKDEVKRVVKMVMGREGKGGEMKRRAAAMAQKLRAAVHAATKEGEIMESSVKALDDFAATMISKSRKQIV